ncbi:adenylyl-sulfate kinase, partial [Campylobacter sp.]|uniref:adenylyl-sulfate kinase n=1 Tax=Campylobacter sp. TaxID=205 RepID=UPI002AA5E6F0
DGDDFREVFEHSFGYSKEARINITRKKIALCVALAKQGFCVVHTAISLFNECYQHNRELCEKNHLKYIEIYIKCPLEVLEKRDQKGLYSKAKAGLQKDVVGMDIAFDEPKAHLVLGGTNSTETNVANILEFLNF